MLRCPLDERVSPLVKNSKLKRVGEILLIFFNKVMKLKLKVQLENTTLARVNFVYVCHACIARNRILFN